ncbi:MAG: hypothetical protein Q9169_006655 [Polycauliona sp. 2 TL-2023]
MKSESTTTMKSRCMRLLGTILEQLATFLYHEQFKRITLKPMTEIIQHEHEPELQQRLLRQWAQSKIREASYVQLAGGLLFTTVASCLQWPSVIEGHWSARACFYASILICFIAIVMGSQQMLLLPHERPPSEIPGDNVAARDSNMTYEREMKEKEELYLRAIVKRLCDTQREDGGPNLILLFVMQAPEMLLTGSAVAFMAGLTSVVFAPLANSISWDDNAKVWPTPDRVGRSDLADMLLPVLRSPSASVSLGYSVVWFS